LSSHPITTRIERERAMRFEARVQGRYSPDLTQSGATLADQHAIRVRSLYVIYVMRGSRWMCYPTATAVFRCGA
jgi:hypothetical protein